MKKSFKTGVSFGLVSGVLTTLGLLIGIGISTESKIAVISGVLTIAIADALSDAFGIHLSQESSGVKSDKHIWEATFATFVSKFLFALTFLIPILLFKIDVAIVISIVWGMFLIGYLSYVVSKGNDDKKGEFFAVITEHFALFTIVILSSYFVGKLINNFLN